jgi:hypothetical protein
MKKLAEEATNAADEAKAALALASSPASDLGAGDLPTGADSFSDLDSGSDAESSKRNVRCLKCEMNKLK